MEHALEVERRELADARAALSAKTLSDEKHRQDLAETAAALASVYASTSWRVTLPLRDASRVAKMMRSTREPR
jgi:hypothetical protein